MEGGSNEKIYSVSEFLDSVKNLLSQYKVVVQGEISSFQQRGTNYYICLKDKDGSVLNCYAFEDKVLNLGVKLEVGLEVRIYGYANIFKPNGSFQLYSLKIYPIGEGVIKQAFDQRKKELSEKGYFNLQRKRPLPLYPKNIGVISSKDGDALKDFRKHLVNYGLNINFIDVRVEGARAEEEVVRAIRCLNESDLDLDLIVLIRGGGSAESLHTFNSVEIAKAIYGSKLPVLTGIGHDKDILIADMVADKSASTPTDAGKILSQSWKDAVLIIPTLEENITSKLKSAIRLYREKIDNYQDYFIYFFNNNLLVQDQNLDGIKNQILSHSNSMLSGAKGIQDGFVYNLRIYSDVLLRTNENLVDIQDEISRSFGDRMHEIKETESKAVSNISLFSNCLIYQKKEFNKELRSIEVFSRSWLRNIKNKIETIDEKLDSNNPENRLKQGYSIITNSNGKVIKSTKELNISDILKVKLYQGSVESQIIKKIDQNEQQ